MMVPKMCRFVFFTLLVSQPCASALKMALQQTAAGGPLDLSKVPPFFRPPDLSEVPPMYHPCLEGCTAAFDGCNNCFCDSVGQVGDCTDVSCSRYGLDKGCKEWKSGYSEYSTIAAIVASWADKPAATSGTWWTPDDTAVEVGWLPACQEGGQFTDEKSWRNKGWGYKVDGHMYDFPESDKHPLCQLYDVEVDDVYKYAGYKEEDVTGKREDFDAARVNSCSRMETYNKNVAGSPKLENDCMGTFCEASCTTYKHPDMHNEGGQMGTCAYGIVSPIGLCACNDGRFCDQERRSEYLPKSGHRYGPLNKVTSRDAQEFPELMLGSDCRKQLCWINGSDFKFAEPHAEGAYLVPIWAFFECDCQQAGTGASKGNNQFSGRAVKPAAAVGASRGAVSAPAPAPARVAPAHAAHAAHHGHHARLGAQCAMIEDPALKQECKREQALIRQQQQALNGAR